MSKKFKKPDCYKCVHKRDIPGDCHIRCNNVKANVIGDEHGIRNYWFLFPYNFDPIWLFSCDGFSDDPKKNIKGGDNDPLVNLLSILAGRN